jgi:hypothetical protein
MRLGKEATCIYCTSLKQSSRPIILAILTFGFLALLVVDASRLLAHNCSRSVFFLSFLDCVLVISMGSSMNILDCWLFKEEEWIFFAMCNLCIGLLVK